MNKLLRILIILGVGLITTSIIIFLIVFIPVLREEINYSVNKNKYPTQEIKPVDKEFSIVIPKINANAKIIKNVDPNNSNEYQIALSKGVAHARGTGFPKENKNIFLFSHSSANLLEASRYNSVFYLLDKLEKDDEILVYYNFEKILYKVTEKKIVYATDIKYINPQIDSEKLTLMTCWPSGTSYKRLIVLADLQNK